VEILLGTVLHRRLMNEQVVAHGTGFILSGIMSANRSGENEYFHLKLVQEATRSAVDAPTSERARRVASLSTTVEKDVASAAKSETPHVSTLGTKFASTVGLEEKEPLRRSKTNLSHNVLFGVALVAVHASRRVKKQKKEMRPTSYALWEPLERRFSFLWVRRWW
jgi:hypothetical protein